MDGNTENILEVHNLVRYFEQPRSFFDAFTARKPKRVNAVNGVSFNVKRGTVRSLVGESGCGKTTAARTVIRLYKPQSGSVIFDGEDITKYDNKELLPFRRKMQMIFQDPYSSLNSRKRIADAVMEPILLHGIESKAAAARERAIALLERVGIRREQADRFPHQFSGGQRQRVGIARALAMQPEFIVADEPVSALDVSIQAQILNLMMDIKDEFGLSYLMIAHDLSVVRHISDTLSVMYMGFIVEQGDRDEVFDRPRHPYTKALLEAAPYIDKKTSSAPLEGEPPNPLMLPKGCAFFNRCPNKMPVCAEERPQLIGDESHSAACHLL